MNNSGFFRKVARNILLLTAFVPLISTSFSVYPFVFGKTLLFTSIVEVSLVMLCLHLFKNPNFNGFSLNRIQKYLLSACGLFILFYGVSTVMSIHSYLSFWGMVSKGDGFFMMLHLLVFVFISFVVFGDREWNLYAKFNIGVSIFVSLVAWAQLFTRTGIEQPSSTLGNAAYLASYLTLVLAFVAISFKKSSENSSRRIFVSYLVFIISTIVITEIRAALLGLFVGAIVWVILFLPKCKSAIFKKIAISLVVFFSIFGGVFISTRSASVWTKMPVLKRLAVISINSASIQERLEAWKAGINGFLEKPFFGWGSGQFESIYNKYGHTNIEDFRERSFTSAHNKIVDALVEGGIFGLIGYLFLCGVVLWIFRKNALFVGLFVAYFVQDLFIFDTITAYVMFFTIIAYGFCISGDNNCEEVENHTERATFASQKTIARVGSVFVLLATIYVFSVSVIIPFSQQIAFGKFGKVSSAQELEKLFDRATSVDTPQQADIRRSIVEMLRGFGVIQNPLGRPFFARALTALEESVAKNPDDITVSTVLLESYIDFGEYDKSYYLKAKILSEDMINRAPNVYRTQLYLALVLTELGRFAEAKTVVDSVTKSFPNSARANVYFAYIAMKMNGDPREYLSRCSASLDVQKSTFEKRDFKILLNMFFAEKMSGEFDTALKYAIESYPNEKYFYQIGFASYVLQKNVELLENLFAKLKKTSYAASLPISKWSELLAARNWDLLSKEEFISDTFGKYSVL